MNIDYGNWGVHLLFALMCIVIAIVRIFQDRKGVEYWLSLSVLLQGILLMFVASAAFFDRQSSLKLGGAVIAGLLVFHSTLVAPSFNDEQAEEDQSTS